MAGAWLTASVCMRLDEAEVVGDRGGVRQEVADPGAALAVLRERLDRRRAASLPFGLPVMVLNRLPRDGRLGDRLAVQLLQLRLVVEQIDVRRARRSGTGR